MNTFHCKKQGPSPMGLSWQILGAKIDNLTFGDVQPGRGRIA
jgi:hypothetical protein